MRTYVPARAPQRTRSQAKGEFNMSLLKREPSNVSWNPFQELRQMSERLNRLFETDFPVLKPSEQTLTMFDWAPAVNITETEKAYQVRADLPGVKKEDIKLSHENGVLTISGERRQELKETKGKVHREESAFGSFCRTFTLPDDADAEHIEAVHKDGALSVTIPRSAAKQPKTQSIKIS